MSLGIVLQVWCDGVQLKVKLKKRSNHKKLKMCALRKEEVCSDFSTT